MRLLHEMRRLGPGLFLLLCGTALAAAQKPDFKLFSIQPKYLTNHTTTTVHWAGTHFAGVELTARGVCRVLSYTSTDTGIVMKIQAERPLTDKLGYCNLYLRNRYGSNDSWIMVNFTAEDQKQIKAAQLARDHAQIHKEMAAAGQEWTIRLSNGSTSTFHAGPPDSNGIVRFKDSQGTEITIVLMDDGTAVLQFPNGCARFGKLQGGHVSNGMSNSDCSPGGAWSAEVK